MWSGRPRPESYLRPGSQQYHPGAASSTIRGLFPVAGSRISLPKFAKSFIEVKLFRGYAGGLHGAGAPDPVELEICIAEFDFPRRVVSRRKLDRRTSRRILGNVARIRVPVGDRRILRRAHPEPARHRT